MTDDTLDELSINTIRMLSADAVEKAKSGHPGLPMGAAAFAYTLWMKHLKHNPKNPDWLNRDRFILSAGHGSMLLYSLLHLTGYDVSIEDLKQFRQWQSKTPGHPEYRHTPGVETTTGPLGQGFANGVGMGLAEKILADRFNQPDNQIIDYYIYALVSDGDLMEGITSEAASYAGSLKLGNLIYLYDSNSVSIEGSTSLTFLEDTASRFSSYGWQVQTVEDGNNISEVNQALVQAKKDDRPSLIVLKTHIGFGSPNKHDSSSAHGAPLGEEEIKLTKQALSWPETPTFFVPEEVKQHMRSIIDSGAKKESEWNEQFTKYKTSYPELAAELERTRASQLPDNWQSNLPDYSNTTEPQATREASGRIMNAIAPALPLFIGGSADLAPSNNSHLKSFGDIAPNLWHRGARNLHFGIREHAMGGILNGLAITPGIIPFGATFLCFSDYMRAPIRLAAIMKLGVIYIFTHDSIGQGEDGTTHQPIEHLASLRAMPGLSVIRPADAAETVEAWRFAISNRTGPTALILTRQKLPSLNHQILASEKLLDHGGYVLKSCQDSPKIILIATGSEVSITLAASDSLSSKGINNWVVSMPSTELFDAQTTEYKQQVLPPGIPRLSVEAASTYGWRAYVGDSGDSIGIDQFGASAPGNVMFEKFGFTLKNIVSRAESLLERNTETPS